MKVPAKDLIQQVFDRFGATPPGNTLDPGDDLPIPLGFRIQVKLEKDPSFTHNSSGLPSEIPGHSPDVARP